MSLKATEWDLQIRADEEADDEAYLREWFRHPGWQVARRRLARRIHALREKTIADHRLTEEGFRRAQTEHTLLVELHEEPERFILGEKTR